MEKLKSFDPAPAFSAPQKKPSVIKTIAVFFALVVGVFGLVLFSFVFGWKLLLALVILGAMWGLAKVIADRI